MSWGAVSTKRAPPSPQARSRVITVVAAVSSRKTKRLGSM
jgi:hypothetical protein